MPASRAAINPGTSQWRGCSTTGSVEVEGAVRGAARAMPSRVSATEQEHPREEVERNS
jgi:hypothetical protein